MSAKLVQADYRVRSADVAALLRSPLEFKRLMHFLRPEGSTVSAFAQASGLSVNAAFRKVERYRAHGLLRLLREERRAGRSLKVYVCPHRSFFIGQEWITIEEQVSEVFEPLRQLMCRSMAQVAGQGFNPVGGMILTVTPKGVWMLPADRQGRRWQPQQAGTPAYLHDCGPLFLNHEDAKALQRELNELFDRYREKRGAATYLLHQFLTPVNVPPHEYVFPHAGHTELI